MIRAVLFDVGGTLHEVHHSPELEACFCQRLLDLLSAHGIALPVTAAELAALAVSAAMLLTKDKVFHYRKA